MSEVGALVIKLQAETAQFRSDMGKVKQDLDSLKDKTGEVGDATDVNFTKARGSIMLLESATGVRLPRALNTLITSIPAVGAAFQTMLPLFGIAAAIFALGKLVDLHQKLKDEAFATEISQKALGATIGTVFGDLQDKFLQAGIKADELNGNHFAALKKTLELIDHQSLSELASTFEKLAKTADASFATIQTHWYQFGNGSEGAKHSLAEFQAQYELLLDTGKDAQANKLLDDKVAREKQILAIQKELAATDGGANIEKHMAAVKQSVALTGDILSSTKNEIKAEQDLVDILLAQVEAHKTIVATASLEKGTATKKTNLQALSEEATLQKIIAAGVEQHSQALLKLAQSQAAATQAENKTGSGDDIDGRLSREKQAIEDEKATAIASAQAELVAKEQAYNADLKAAAANVQKKRELNATWANDVHAYSDSVINIESEANTKIVAATAQATAERIRLAEELAQAQERISTATAGLQMAQTMAAISATQSAEQRASALGLSTARQELEEKRKLIEQESQAKLSAIQQEISATQRLASQEGAAGNRAKQNEDLSKAITLQEQLTNETANYAKQLSTVDTDLSKLNSSWTNYFAKMKTETADLATQIRTQLQSSVTQFSRAFGDSMARAIVENKSLGQAVRQEAGQMLEAMISMLVQWLEKWIISHTMAAIFGQATGKTEQLAAAQLAGANMVASYSAAPWPIDTAAPAMGAAAFAAAMSFEIGGKIPGNAGPVPIIGHAGETVVTKALTDRVEASERGGGKGAGEMHMHFSPHIHAVDSEGVDRMLTKHSSKFEAHVRATFRRMNK